MKKNFNGGNLSAANALRCGMCVAASVLAVTAMNVRAEEGTVQYTVSHTFSVADVQGGFNGTTYGGVEGSLADPGIICGIGFDCPQGAKQPFEDNGTTLYPIDSEFGFYVADFVGAAPKERDNDYAEGWAGNIYSNGEIIGLKISNAPTDTFKVKAPTGTWCAGLGGNKVKCSTEHFVVLEHLKTCYETIPYRFADYESGEQGKLYDPGTLLNDEPTVVGSCEYGMLDNYLYKHEGGQPTEYRLLDEDLDGFPDMAANESSVLHDIAVGRDYSITVKDDGKPLYRFGSMVKRPNDVRLYARMALPQEWKDNPDQEFTVTRAELHIDHMITNNPNDQVRPEDMENEGATGRLPGYETYGDLLISTRDCYEGDGDFIGEGTVFKNPTFANDIGSHPDHPIPFSEDLKEGWTNAWYTTTDRDPFEPDPVTGIGPRWRLKANKFGQDLPGLEIPSNICMPTPYTSKYIKYDVGSATTTVINLLDAEGISPLLTSNGWMDDEYNEINIDFALDPEQPEITVDPFPNVSVNGLPLTEDFDLAVYVKGDRKPTAVYNATLVIEYVGNGTSTPPGEEGSFDLAIDSFRVPKRFVTDKSKKIRTYISNLGEEVASGTLTLEAYLPDLDTVVETITEHIGSVAPGEEIKIITPWTPPYYEGSTVEWTAVITAEGDADNSNNSAIASSTIR